MRLLFDVGNTRLKWALEDAGSFIATGAMTHAELQNLKHLSDSIPVSQPFSMWVSCVGAGHSLELLKQHAKTEFGVRMQTVSVVSEAAGISNAYADLERLGVDRWVAAIGARQLIGSGALIVIDAGTAVTIDLLDQENVYQGGTILPGARLMHDSLVSQTVGIESDWTASPPIIGKSTSECVNSGVHYGLVGAVERVIAEMQKSLPRKAKILLSGGDSQLIQRNSKISMRHADNLVLTGLHALADEAEG